MSGEKTGYYEISGYISIIFCGEEGNIRPLFYLACQTCKKKVIDDSTGYRCERCEKTYQDAVPTYMFAIKFSDFTDSQIFNVLGEGGDAIIGMPANEFYEIHDNHVKI